MGIVISLGRCTPKQLSEQTANIQDTESTTKGAVGWEIYRQLDRLPQLTSGVRTRQFSSFDRTGGNSHDGFSGKFSCLRITDKGRCVIAEASGAGQITSIWFTRNRGDISANGMLTIKLDGEVVLQAPLQKVVNGELGPPFVFPLVANADQSSGGTYIKVPMPYRESMLVMTENRPRFYILTYQAFANAESVETFDPSEKALDVLEKLHQAGYNDPKALKEDARTLTKSFNLSAGKSIILAELEGPGVITELRLRIPRIAAPNSNRHISRAVLQASQALLEKVRLRISFDGNQTVDSPIGMFFGSGLGEREVRALFFAMDTSKTGWYSSWWPMPFRRKATVTLVNVSNTDIKSADLTLSWAPSSRAAEGLSPTGNMGYFHATYHKGLTQMEQDWRFLDVEARGKFVGVVQAVEGREPGRSYLEGDVRVYVDGIRSPKLHGTGTEDFYQGGWYFNRGTFTNFSNGNPLHEVESYGCPHQCDSMYRLMIGAAVPFGKSLRFSVQHGPHSKTPAIYRSTAFWYGRSEPALVRTDVLDVGNKASEWSHNYHSPRPGSVEILTSVFVGDFDEKEITNDLRATNAPITFELDIKPERAEAAEEGVILRRMTDQSKGYQAARVYVDGEKVGLWKQPMGNSYQRWLEDQFLLPATMTAGKKSITVRLVPLEGAPKWHAARYEAFVYIKQK